MLDPCTTDHRMLDIAMLFLRRKAWFFATNKRNQNFPMRFLICTAMIVLGGGAGAFDLTNVALNKPTDQGPGTLATVENGLDPSYYQSHQAVDGRTKTESEFCTHTIDARPVWWLVDLQTTYQIQSVTILNGGNEFENFTVDVFDQDPRTAVGFPGTLGKICAHHNYDVPSGWWVTLNCDSGYLTGRFLRVIRLEHNYLSFCEVRHGTTEKIYKRLKVMRKLCHIIQISFHFK